MSKLETYTLVGFVEPSGMSLGFLVPLFNSRLSNAPFLQVLDENRVIADFELYGAPDAHLLDAPSIKREVGDPGIYAFAFGKDDLEVAMSDELISFSRRLDDPVLAERPLVAMELADFLDLTDRRCEFALRAHASMKKASEETANYWRDLSVLTTELRRTLASRPERSARRFAKTVIARVLDRIVQLDGTGDRTSVEQLELLKAATIATLSKLAPLYRTPIKGWDVRLRRKVHRSKDEDYDAALLLASPHVLHRESEKWSYPPNVEVFTRDGPEFARVVEETETPLFVAYDTHDPEQIRKATGDWTVRDMHGIGINFSKQKLPDEDGQFWRTTQLPKTGIREGGAFKAARGIIADMRLAIAAELDRRDADISWRPTTAFLLRARGLSSDPESYAWATLYDRAWSLGTAPWDSLLLPRRNPAPAFHGREPGWVADALFDQPRYLRRSRVSEVMKQSRATAALLVNASLRSTEDHSRHRSAIIRLLKVQGWRMRDDEYGDAYEDIRTNATAPAAVLEVVAQPDAAGLALLRDAAVTMKLSARGYHRVLRVARTLADLDGAEQIGRLHLAESLSYRALADDSRRAA